MSNAISSVQDFVLLLLGVGALGLTAYAAFDAFTRKAQLFPLAGRQTKVLWVSLLGVAVLLAIVSLFNPLFFLNVLGVIAAGVYLADVRPRLRQLGGGGRSSSSGPYGPW